MLQMQMLFTQCKTNIWYSIYLHQGEEVKFPISGWLLSSPHQIPRLFEVFPMDALFIKPPEVWRQA